MIDIAAELGKMEATADYLRLVIKEWDLRNEHGDEADPASGNG